DAVVSSLYAELRKARGTVDEERIKTARDKAVVENGQLQKLFNEVHEQHSYCNNQIAILEAQLANNQTDERRAIANVVQLEKDLQQAAKLVKTVAWRDPNTQVIIE